jgi:iron complex transport system substrate-binding protein
VDVRFPIVSVEGILGARPEVILDLSVTRAGSPEKAQEAVADWQRLAGELEAVRRGRVYAIADDYATIPGPRFILLVEKLARLLHPEADWEEAG